MPISDKPSVIAMKKNHERYIRLHRFDTHTRIFWGSQPAYLYPGEAKMQGPVSLLL